MASQTMHDDATEVEWAEIGIDPESSDGAFFDDERVTIKRVDGKRRSAEIMVIANPERLTADYLIRNHRFKLFPVQPKSRDKVAVYKSVK